MRIPSEEAERWILSGISEKLLAPDVLKAAEQEVHRQLREHQQKARRESGDLEQLQARLADIEIGLGNVTDAIATVGLSDALAEKLRKLEREKKRLQKRASTLLSPLELPNITGIRDRWVRLVKDLGSAARKAAPERVAAVRQTILDMFGQVALRQEPGKQVAALGLANQGSTNGPEMVAGARFDR